MSPAEKLAADLGAPVREIDGAKVSPMLCAQDGTSERVLSQPGWIYELKLDGVRIIADKREARVRLSYRKLRDATKNYPEIAEAVAVLAEPRVVLDGEVLAFDEHGMPDFQRLAQRIQGRSRRSHVGVLFVVFDVLAVGARDVRGLPIEARKEILGRVVPAGDEGLVRLHITFDDGEALFRLCRERGLEGVVAKRGGSTYRSGERTADWVKVKHEHDAEFVVVGWTEGEGRRSRLGALDLASYEGDRLVVRGAVGTGLDEDTIDALLDRLRALEVDRPVAEGRYSPGKGRRHVRPAIVVSVRYLTFTADGVLRFPVFRGVREDVQPRDCTVGPGGDRRHMTTPTAPALADGTTKDALRKYYERVAGALLPYVAGRPSIPLRTAGPLLPLPKWTPSWVKTTTSRGGAGPVRGVVVDDVDALRFLIEAGCVSLLATPRSEAAPDALDWVALRGDAAGARAALSIADAIGLPAHAKYAGGGALDVLVAVGGAREDVARALAALVARLATEQAGSAVSAVDAVVAPWAVLPESPVRVAAPVAREELGREPPAPDEVDPGVPDPMLALLGAEVDVPRAVRALERAVSERARG